ncbi:hypothetical protein ACVITL_004878 [Rhizobium pisi]
MIPPTWPKRAAGWTKPRSRSASAINFVKNTPYAAWFDGLHSGASERSDPGTTCCIDHLAGRPARIVRCKESDDVGNVFRPADTGKD